MTNQDNQPNNLYKLYDSLTDSLVEVMSLSAIRVWLANLWDENPDEEMTNEEHQEMIEEIMESDAEELSRRLSGVGYHMEEETEQ
ncbi:hypothetical protein CN918_30495 [Priestia megaterium]|nr:hypothetical protein CN918_30495 [Priestia megaterium]